jgi:hypothetical protein
MDAIVNAYVGWYLVGMDDGGDAFAKWMKDIAAAYNRKGVQTTLKTELRGDAKFMPSVKLVPAPGPLGRGALDLEIRVADIDAPTGFGKRGDKVTVVAHMLYMPDGKGGWLAIGTNRDELVKRLVTSRTGAPDGGTLAARGGLDPLKSGSFLSAGFITVAPFTKGAGSAATIAAQQVGGLPPQMTDVMKTLSSLPHRGETPVFITTKVVAGNAPHLDTRLTIQKGTFEDVGAIVSAGIRAYNSLRGGGPAMPPPPGKP